MSACRIVAPTYRRVCRDIVIRMALFKTLKRAFGFGDHDLEDEEPEGIDARVTPLRRRGDEDPVADDNDASQAVKSAEGEASVVSDAEAVENAKDPRIVPAAIFETVVKIFNESLPDFIRESVDEKIQREYIYSALDSSMRDYMEQLAVDARRRCDARWEGERNNLMRQLDELRRQSQKNEEDSSDSRKQQLSAERQKRALGERVRDLEKQLEAAHAENEQYILENKSLVNKIRLASVLGGEGMTNVDEEVAAKYAELTEKYEALQAETAIAKEAEKTADENVARLTAENGGLRSENLVHLNEISKLREALEQSRVKDDLGDAMLTDLNAKLAAAMENLRVKLQEVADKEAEIEQLQREKENIKREYANLKITHDATSEQLAEALENLAVVEQLHRQVTALEEARHANEAFLRKQKDEIMQKEELLHNLEIEKREFAEALKKKEEAIRTLEDIADNLRKTIEDNLYEHAQAESALRFEIERLKETRGMVAQEEAVAAVSEPVAEYISAASDFEIVDDSKTTPQPKAKKGKGARKSKLKISAIDDTIEDTDWLIATPPPSKRKKEQADDDKPDFGYKEPARKTAPDNPAQMSLW